MLIIILIIQIFMNKEVPKKIFNYYRHGHRNHSKNIISNISYIKKPNQLMQLTDIGYYQQYLNGIAFTTSIENDYKINLSNYFLKFYVSQTSRTLLSFYANILGTFNLEYSLILDSKFIDTSDKLNKELNKIIKYKYDLDDYSKYEDVKEFIEFNSPEMFKNKSCKKHISNLTKKVFSMEFNDDNEIEKYFNNFENIKDEKLKANILNKIRLIISKGKELNEEYNKIFAITNDSQLKENMKKITLADLFDKYTSINSQDDYNKLLETINNEMKDLKYIGSLKDYSSIYASYIYEHKADQNDKFINSNNEFNKKVLNYLFYFYILQNYSDEYSDASNTLTNYFILKQIENDNKEIYLMSTHDTNLFPLVFLLFRKEIDECILKFEDLNTLCFEFTNFSSNLILEIYSNTVVIKYYPRSLGSEDNILYKKELDINTFIDILKSNNYVDHDIYTISDKERNNFIKNIQSYKNICSYESLQSNNN